METKEAMHYTEYFPEVMKILTTRGVLITAWIGQEKANAMTIGWGTIGSVWGRPIWQIAVRPSRFTYTLLQTEFKFGINILGKSHLKAMQVCGSNSGRDLDKVSACGLSIIHGPHTDTPIIVESVIHYECHVIHANDFDPAAMILDVRKGSYPAGDFHRVYWGEIIDCCVDRSKLNDL
jgi:flavin reductase (DIM6/NTAB) family NADH-FMN oxidoreductase RutF